MSHSFDEAKWIAWQKSEIEKYGNDHAGWIAVSRNLVLAGAVLSRMYSSALAIMNGGSSTDRPRTDDEDATVQRGHQTHAISLMLFGFGIECLLKAVYLKRGGKLYSNGKYDSSKRPKRSHNLLEIAENLECSTLFTDQQQEVLDLLSARNESGRYPVHSKFDAYGIKLPNDNKIVRFYGVWDAGKSTVVFEILKTLYTEIGEPIPDDANALLEQNEIVRKSYGNAVSRADSK